MCVRVYDIIFIHIQSNSGPEVVWDRTRNPYPWQNIDQNTQVKLMTVNQKFDKVYSRDRL